MPNKKAYTKKLQAGLFLIAAEVYKEGSPLQTWEQNLDADQKPICTPV